MLHGLLGRLHSADILLGALGTRFTILFLRLLAVGAGILILTLLVRIMCVLPPAVDAALAALAALVWAFWFEREEHS